MKITTELLESLDACQSGINLVATYPDKDHEAVIRRLVADDHWDYANWLLPRLMSYKGYVSYAVYAAKLVLPIWEKQYPKDGRPRKAIEAAKRCIDDPSDENKEAARAWAAAAWAARAEAEVAEAAEAARAAAAAAAWAVEAAWAAVAAAAATEAENLAGAAAWAANLAVARAAANLAGAEKIKSKITEKGLKILKK